MKKLTKVFKGFLNGVKLWRREQMKERHHEDMYIIVFVNHQVAKEYLRALHSYCGALRR